MSSYGITPVFAGRSIWQEEELTVIPGARIPVIKASEHVSTLCAASFTCHDCPCQVFEGIAFDVVINNVRAVHNSKLIASYVAFDTRARDVILLVSLSARG